MFLWACVERQGGKHTNSTWLCFGGSVLLSATPAPSSYLLRSASDCSLHSLCPHQFLFPELTRRLIGCAIITDVSILLVYVWGARGRYRRCRTCPLDVPGSLLSTWLSLLSASSLLSCSSLCTYKGARFQYVSGRLDAVSVSLIITNRFLCQLLFLWHFQGLGVVHVFLPKFRGLTKLCGAVRL